MRVVYAHRELRTNKLQTRGHKKIKNSLACEQIAYNETFCFDKKCKNRASAAIWRYVPRFVTVPTVFIIGYTLKCYMRMF